MMTLLPKKNMLISHHCAAIMFDSMPPNTRIQIKLLVGYTNRTVCMDIIGNFYNRTTHSTYPFVKSLIVYIYYLCH